MGNSAFLVNVVATVLSWIWCKFKNWKQCCHILQMQFRNLLLQKYNNNYYTWVHNRDL